MDVYGNYQFVQRLGKAIYGSYVLKVFPIIGGTFRGEMAN
jgi:hypothetical protein